MRTKCKVKRLLVIRGKPDWCVLQSSLKLIKNKFGRRRRYFTRRGFLIMSTRPSWVAILFLTVAAGSSSGQPPAPAAQQEAMKKLDFLVGQWKGEGWMEFAPGQRRTFKGTEVVQRKLEGL